MLVSGNEPTIGVDEQYEERRRNRYASKAYNPSRTAD
jgi:hypothetical protein